jgi:hypothetical protein
MFEDGAFRSEHKCDCGQPIPPRMVKCSMCRAEETRERRRKDKRADKCSECGTPIPFGDRRHGVRCKFCTKKRDLDLEKIARRKMVERRMAEKRELKSRW